MPTQSRPHLRQRHAKTAGPIWERLIMVVAITGALWTHMEALVLIGIVLWR